MIVEPLELIMTVAFEGSKPALGFSDDEISAAEARLGVDLPEALRDYYSVAGKYYEMMDSDFDLLTLEELRIHSGYLVFCEENQGLAEWGIRLDELTSANPAVVGRATDDDQWFTESSKLSAFLINVGCWQAIMSLGEKARCELPEKELSGVEKLFEPIGDDHLRLGGNQASFVDRTNSILATYLYVPEMIYVGTPDEDAIEELETRSGLDFDWL